MTIMIINKNSAFRKILENLTISVHMTTKEYNGIKYGCMYIYNICIKIVHIGLHRSYYTKC